MNAAEITVVILIGAVVIGGGYLVYQSTQTNNTANTGANDPRLAGLNDDPVSAGERERLAGVRAATSIINDLSQVGVAIANAANRGNTAHTNATNVPNMAQRSPLVEHESGH